MFTELLALLFIGLKLGGVIDWSWWWVLSPILIPVGLFVVFAAVAFPVLWVWKRREIKKTLKALEEFAELTEEGR
jgi:membrane protein DedA with SNARE-associated domain